MAKFHKKIKYKNFVFICVAIFSLIQIKAQDKGTHNFIVLQNQDEIAISSIPILDGTVIKFDKESVTLKIEHFETRIEKSQLKYFEHLNDYRTDFTVRVLTNGSCLFPVKDKLVTIHNEYDNKLEDITNSTDENGELQFSGLPSGFYTLFVTDPDNIFEDLVFRGVHQGTSSFRDILINENVEMPSSLNYNIISKKDGLYDILLEWEILGTSVDYSFEIYLNDELIDEISDNSFNISNLEAGEYIIYIVSKSRFGNKSSRAGIIINSEEFSSGIETVEKDEESTPGYYVDMQGRIVKNPMPGIYILNGKKFIVR